MINPIKLQQGTPEWLKFRIGACTGSRVADAMSFLKRASNGRPVGASSQCRMDYMLEIALERITGIFPDHFVTPAMQHGIDTEPHAVLAYEAITETPCHKVGIAVHPSIPMYMASPDRYIGSNGVLEVKCPTSMVHLEYLRGGVVPEQYIPQCLSELSCDPSRDWLDFVSFDPRFTGPAIKLQIFIAPRMYRAEWATQIAEVEDGVRKFLAETAALTAELQELAEKRKF